ncbi:hypothetical protein Q3C01_38185 [Bradyrhizobium sp. UFLA05-109]
MIVGSGNVAGDREGYQALRWASRGGTTDLGTLGGPSSSAFGVSTDGSVVVGSAQIPDTSDEGFYIFHAFRWTSSTGMVDLGTLGGHKSSARGVSADGAVVVGSSHTPEQDEHAFRWTSDTGMIDLGTLGGPTSGAHDTSADGSVVVGSSMTSRWDGNHAFRWTRCTGMVDLGTLGGRESNALAVSADGSVVVGYAETADGTAHAFRWTAEAGMLDLGSPEAESYATGITADGATIVGRSVTDDSAFHAFRWTAPDHSRPSARVERLVPPSME